MLEREFSDRAGKTSESLTKKLKNQKEEKVETQKIILKKRRSGVLCHLDGDPKKRGYGKCPDEAIGNLISSRQSELNIKIEWDNDDPNSRN